MSVHESPRPPRPKITHVQFFQLCDALRNKQEVVQKECSSVRDVKALMDAILGWPVPLNSVEKALDTVNITITNKRTSRTGASSASHILIRAVSHLYNKLGEPLPKDLVELMDAWHISKGVLQVEPAAPVPAIPLKSVPPASAIPVVTPHPRPNERR